MYLKNSACTLTPMCPLYISRMPRSWSVAGRLKEWAVVSSFILSVMLMVVMMMLCQARQNSIAGTSYGQTRYSSQQTVFCTVCACPETKSAKVQTQ